MRDPTCGRVFVLGSLAEPSLGTRAELAGLGRGRWIPRKSHHSRPDTSTFNHNAPKQS